MTVQSAHKMTKVARL